MGGDATSTSRSRPRWASWVKGISIAIILISLLLGMRALPLERLSDALQSAIQRWGVWGPVFFGAIYAVAVVCLIPGSLLTLAGGAVFGLAQGTLIVSLAATTGAAMAFLLARYLAREKVQRYVRQSPKLSAVDQAIGEEGWKIVALLRLSPAVPFTLQNYLYGVTAIRFWPCILTSWVAMLPGTFMYVYLGSLGSQALAGGETSTAEWIARGVGLLATAAVTVYLTRLARRAMQERVALQPPEPAEDGGAKSFEPASRAATSLWIVAAMIFLALAIGAHWQQDSLRSAIENLLGLPPE
jgi:uncharacterized membrane protein YdjX (TVP38/TMEM64 family)